VRAALAAVVLAVAVAGCGGQSATQKATSSLQTSLDRLSLTQNYGELLKDAESRPALLATHLHRYDLSARALADDIGKDRVRRMLADDATSIQDVCSRCAVAIDRTRATL
jgi:hypothetical protein